MTLGRLVVAWLLVAIWFGASLWVNLFMLMGLLKIARRPGAGVMGSIPRVMLYWRPVEALILTLFASLWFDSLGSGEWWLVFLLVGILVTVPMHLELHDRSRPEWKLTFAASQAGELLRYVVAGALLAWRLS